MEPNKPQRYRGTKTMRWHEWVAFWLLVGAVIALAGLLALESTRNRPPVPYHDFRDVAHWFDPVFFQYNLLLVVLAALIVPFVTLSYVRTMAGRKVRRLRREVPEKHSDEIHERVMLRNRFSAFLGSVVLTTSVVLLGASIILLFKPVPSGDLPGVDFSHGGNVLLMGSFIELFTVDPHAYYIHLTRSITAFQFGFLGAYIYFIYALARAYFTLDLTPQTLVDGSIRMMGASILALVISFVPWIHGGVDAAVTTAAHSRVSAPPGANSPATEEDKSAKSIAAVEATAAKLGEQPAWSLSLIPIMSFVFGFFPKSALLALQRVTSGAIRHFAPDSYRALPMSMLAGMSYAHELRLEREGFDNIENFSTADPIGLAVRTGFGYMQLVQWVSEAWLAIHLRDEYPEFVQRTGITSRDELQRFFSRWDAARGDPVAHLTRGITDSPVGQVLAVKLAAIATLLDATPTVG